MTKSHIDNITVLSDLYHTDVLIILQTA